MVYDSTNGSVHAQDMRSGLYMMTYKMDDGDLETLFRGLSNMTVEKEVSFPAQEGVPYIFHYCS